MTVAAIIQARLGSTRLPAKVLLPLPTGRTVLEEVIFRCRQIEGVDVVVVTIPDSEENEILLPVIKRASWKSDTVAAEPVSALAAAMVEHLNRGQTVQVVLSRGTEHDVLKRYALAAEGVNADIVMRITADCPLIDPKVCAAVLRQLQDEDLDYCSNVHPRTFPKGYDCEVFTRAALEWANGDSHFGPFAPAQPGAEWREHVTKVIYKTPSVFKIGNYAQEQDQSETRLTLDTIEDYVAIWNEFKRREVEACA